MFRKGSHFMEQFKRRVMGLPLSQEEIKKILLHIMNVQRTSKGEEGICVHKFDRNVILKDEVFHRRDEDELWVIIRFGTIVTTHRRSSERTFNTNPKSMKVDRVRYQYLQKSINN